MINFFERLVYTVYVFRFDVISTWTLPYLRKRSYWKYIYFLLKSRVYNFITDVVKPFILNSETYIYVNNIYLDLQKKIKKDNV